MAKQVWGRHAKHLTTAQDNTKEISTNEWNENNNRRGFLGFDGYTLASASTVTPPAAPTDMDPSNIANQPSSLIKLSGSTSVDTIAITNTNDGDLLYLVTTGSVTLNNTTSPSSAGDIRLLGNANKDLDTNVPTILIRSGNFWYEYGGSPVTDASITFAKIQNLASMKVIGRTAGSSGVSSEVALLDEDNMASDSATSLATQQSIKAYVDSQDHNISDGEVTNAKLADMAANTIKVRNANSSGVPSDVAVGDTQLLIGDGTGFTAATLSGDVTLANTGAVTVGTLNQSTTGNAATATALATARTIGGTSFDGTANIAVALSATTTALATARTIGGVSFDGTANINLPGVNAAGTQNTSGTAATVTTNANLTGGVTSVGNAATVVTNANLTGDVTSSGNATTLGTVAVAKGGTNLTSYTAGDLLYATGSTTLAKLAKGTAGQSLKMNSGATAPEWAAGGGGAHTEQEWDVYTTHTPSAAVADTDAFMFTRKIDTNNDGLYIQIWKNGASTTVQIA